MSEKNNDAENKFRCWLDATIKNVDFKDDLKDIANEVKNSALTVESDRKFIEEYLDIISEMQKFYKYDKFGPRSVIWAGVLGKLDMFELRVKTGASDDWDLLRGIKRDSSATIFFENYLQRIIAATRDNLYKLFDKMRVDFATKITIDVPVTKIAPDESGNVTFSVKISNAENRDEAEEINLSVENTEGKQIFHKDLSEKILTGGDSISELITIPAETKDAFDVKIIVSYDRGSVEKSVQITVDSGKFEEISNPYITGNPVDKDEMFFGRDDLIERLAKSLKDDTTRCVIIYGQKRSGKSSIFQHLRRKLEDKFVVLSFSTGSDITSEIKFYKKVKAEFERYLRWNKFDEETRKKWKNYTISEYLDFEQFVDEVSEEVCRPKNKELLLMIDEFTALYAYMKNPDYSLGKENFMDRWKAMSEQNLFKSALIGQDNMPEFIRAYPNQFQVTEPIRVSYLEKEYAVKLITEPILFNGKSRYLEGTENKIADWFSGQPYYTQTYCKKLVDYLNSKTANYVTEAVAEDVKNLMLEDSRIDFFDNLVYEKDQDSSWSVLKRIASSDVEDVPIDVSSLSDSEKEALTKLTDREVLTKKQDRYQIKIPFFREWIKEYK